MPKGTTIGAIVREGEVVIPHHDTIFQSDDHVILFISDKKNIRQVEQLFSVRVTYL
jgi:trk system potassium uptake protein TrkA